MCAEFGDSPDRWRLLKESIVSVKVWNLMYRQGNTGRVIGDADNPQSRRSAHDGAETITKNGWRVGVETPYLRAFLAKFGPLNGLTRTYDFVIILT